MDKPKIRPLGARVVVRRLEPEEKTKSGIIIPDSAQDKPQQGLVLVAGPGEWDATGKKRLPMDVREGERVLFKKWGTPAVKVGGEELLVLREDEIIAVLTD